LSGYGFIDVGEVNVGKYRISIVRSESSLTYTRYYEGKPCVSKKIQGKPRIELVPLYPVFTPNIITKYVEIEFEANIVIPGYRNIVSFIKMPVDIGVYVYDEKNNYYLIDVFETNTINYSLYGSIVEGVIARYYKSPVYNDLVKPSFGEAVSKIRIINKHEKIVEVGRIVLDAQIIKMYYKPGTWEAYTQEIYMNILSRDKAIITYGKPFVENIVEINDPEGFKPPKLRSSNEMIWGLK